MLDKQCRTASLGSPVSDDGRGLKQHPGRRVLKHTAGSPVSDDGRGLKRLDYAASYAPGSVRPSVMTGVD